MNDNIIAEKGKCVGSKGNRMGDDGDFGKEKLREYALAHYRPLDFTLDAIRPGYAFNPPSHKAMEGRGEGPKPKSSRERRAMKKGK